MLHSLLTAIRSRASARCRLLAAVVAGLLPILAGPAAAQGDRLVDVQNRGEVRVCIWPDYYGISFRNPKTRQVVGVDADMARELAKELGVRLRFVDSSFATLSDDLLGNRCDLAMFAIAVTPARNAVLRFTHPHLRSDIYAITTRANRRIKSWNDIDTAGVVVAVAKGTLHENIMRERLRHATLLVTTTPHEREQEVEAGRADVFMTDFPYSRRMLEFADWARVLAPPAPYHPSDYAYAMKPGDDRWYARIERFVADVQRDGRLLGAARRYGLDPIVIAPSH